MEVGEFTSRTELELARLRAEVRRQALAEEKLLMELERVKGDHADWASSDGQNCCYQLSGEISGDSVYKAISVLQGWDRRFPKTQPVTMIINCAGGSVINGFALYDTLAGMKHRGRQVITIARGQAASMGAVLLQSGSERLIGENSYLLIHQPKWSSEGASGAHEDLMELSRLMEERAVHALAERSKLSADEIRSGWQRRDWWVGASQAVELGFADRIA